VLWFLILWAVVFGSAVAYGYLLAIVADSGPFRNDKRQTVLSYLK